MPNFTFTSPEGKKYTVTGPEGATAEQAFAILQQQLQPQPAAAPVAPAAPEAPEASEAPAAPAGPVDFRSAVESVGRRALLRANLSLAGLREASGKGSAEERTEALEAYNQELAKVPLSGWSATLASSAEIAIGDVAPVIGAGALAGPVGITVAGVGLVGKAWGELYAHSRAAGRSDSGAATDAAVKSAFYIIPGVTVVKMLRGVGTTLLSQLAKAPVIGATVGVTSETLNTAYDAGVIDDDMTFDEAKERIIEAAKVGVVLGPLGVPVARMLTVDPPADPKPSPRARAGEVRARQELGTSHQVARNIANDESIPGHLRQDVLNADTQVSVDHLPGNITPELQGAANNVIKTNADLNAATVEKHTITATADAIKESADTLRQRERAERDMVTAERDAQVAADRAERAALNHDDSPTPERARKAQETQDALAEAVELRDAAADALKAAQEADTATQTRRDGLWRRLRVKRAERALQDAQEAAQKAEAAAAGTAAVQQRRAASLASKEARLAKLVKHVADLAANPATRPSRLARAQLAVTRAQEVRDRAAAKIDADGAKAAGVEARVAQEAVAAAEAAVKTAETAPFTPNTYASLRRAAAGTRQEQRAARRAENAARKAANTATTAFVRGASRWNVANPGAPIGYTRAVPAWAKDIVDQHKRGVEESGKLDSDIVAAIEGADSPNVTVTNAERVLVDSLADQAGREPGLGLLRIFRSPSHIEAVKDFVRLGTRARAARGRLAVVLNKRVNAIKAALLEGQPGRRLTQERLGDLGRVVEIEGMLGERLTPTDMVVMGLDRGLQKAMTLYRGMMDHLDAITAAEMKKSGRGMPGFIEGFSPHAFHTYRVKAGDTILGSARSLKEAVELGNQFADKGLGEITVSAHAPKPGKRGGIALGEEPLAKARATIGALLNAKRKGKKAWFGHLERRSGALGWDKDFLGRSTEYLNGWVNFISREQFKRDAIPLFERKFGKDRNKLSTTGKYVSDYIDSVAGVPTWIDQVTQKALLASPLGKHIERVLGPNPVASMRSTTSAVTIAMKLGLGVMSAALNLTQLFALGAKVGPKYLALGLRDAGRIPLELMHVLPGESMVKVKRLGIAGEVGFEHHARDIVGPPSRMQRILDGSMIMFRGTEYFARATALLAGWHQAKDMKLGRTAAFDHATGLNRKVNYDYSTVDAPEMFTKAGWAGDLLFKFKKFPIKTMEMLAHSTNKERLAYLMPMFLLGGVAGIPILPDIINLLNHLTGMDLMLEFKAYIRKLINDGTLPEEAGEALVYGGLAPTTGGTVSSRLAGETIPDAGLGAAGPAISSVVRAVGSVADGDWVQAITELSPTVGKAAQTLMHQGTVYSATERGRKVVDLNPAEQAMRVAGITPVKEQVERDTARYLRVTAGTRAGERQELLDKLVLALKRDDQAAVEEMAEDIAKHRITPEQVREEMAKKEMELQQRAIQATPRRLVGELSEKL